MEESKTHIISILFTRYTDFVSKLLYLVSGRSYTHVSISLDTEDTYFYGFNTKGFKKEYPRKHRNRTKENICYRIEISDKSYHKLKKILEDFEKRKQKLSYNWIGIFLCIIGIPFTMKNKFFCSQFIAWALLAAGVIVWKKNYSRYLPAHIKKELDNTELVKEKVFNAVPVATEK